MRTAGVTGAAGAIGSLLVARGYRMIAVDVDAAGLNRNNIVNASQLCPYVHVVTRMTTPATFADASSGQKVVK